MKTFTVIYNTATMKGAQYSFSAETQKQANEKAGKLVTGEIIRVAEVDNFGYLIEPVTVRTSLTTGGTKDVYFAPGKSTKMYDNKPFSKTYTNVISFLKNFSPAKASNHLLDRITEEFYTGGKITFKPEGYKANMTFYFSYEN